MKHSKTLIVALAFTLVFGLMPAQAIATTNQESNVIKRLISQSTDEKHNNQSNSKSFSTLNEAINAGIVAEVPNEETSYVANEVIAVINRDTETQNALESIEEAIDNVSKTDEATSANIFSSLEDESKIVKVTIPEDVSIENALIAVANETEVVRVQPNYIRFIDDFDIEPIPADYNLNSRAKADVLVPKYNDAVWWANVLNMPAAWDLAEKPSSEVTVAIIDSGVRLTHQDIINNIWHDHAWNAVGNEPLTADVGFNGDTSGHGTVVAGMIAAEVNNGIGVAGTSYNAKILPIKANYDDNPNMIDTEAIIRGMDYVLSKRDELNIRVMNTSYNGYEYDEIEHSKVKELTNAGVLVVGAAGNDGDNPELIDPTTEHNILSYPSDYDEVLSVTATDENNQIAVYSDHNTEKDVAAPGELVESLSPLDDVGLALARGTSLAAPAVSGIAALLFAADDALSPTDVKKAIEQTATDVDQNGFDPYYGHGLVEAYEALKYVSVQTDTNKVISAGDYHSLLAKTDGSVWTWGDSNSKKTVIPNRIKSLANVISVSSGSSHSIALKNDGSVWTWGANKFGQLGDGSKKERRVPVKVGITGVKAISAGDGFSLALKNDGSVWAWGQNKYGKLGNGTSLSTNIPRQVSGLSNVVSISAGDNHSLAVKKDGTVWAWGQNKSGKLGDGTSIEKRVPIQLSGINSVSFISAAAEHSLAIKTDGTVWAWGYNRDGRLGDGTTKSKQLPIQITALTEIKTVDAGNNHSIALASDGSLYTWGANSYGQLGNGTKKVGLTPKKIAVENVVSISAGYNFSLIQKLDGSVWAWGQNSYGELGDGSKKSKIAPVQVMPQSVKDIKFNKNKVSMVVGAKRTITASVLPKTATDKTLRWTSSAPNVVSVDASGNIRGIKKGTAIITAISVNDIKETCKVTVSKRF